jgi:hypothetical protein
MTLPWDGRVSDDGSPQIIFIDSERQALWARVGPVYFNGQPHHEPVVWLEYQPQYLASSLSGSVLFSVRTWNQFVNSINTRLTPSVDRRIRRRAARAFALRHLRSRTRVGVSGR